jgi:uncharacterized integral membrane protein
MPIELLVILGIFVGGIVIADVLSGVAMRNLEKDRDAERGQPS